MMSLATFRVRFPEMGNAPDALVNACLDEAGLEMTDTEVWGTQLDVGHGYLAAHKLALSPYGQGARLAAKDDKTTYHTHFMRLAMQNQCGFGRVA